MIPFRILSYTQVTPFRVQQSFIQNYKIPQFSQIRFSRLSVDEDGIETENQELDLKLKGHIPEILPIFGKRFNLWYPEIPKQCKNCFDFNHTAKICNNPREEWLNYVAKLHKTGTFKDELFGSWIETLAKYHPAYAKRDLRGQIEANKQQLGADDLRRQIPQRGYVY